MFAEYDEEATRLATGVRALGFTAVVSATLALIAIATKPVWPYVPGSIGCIADRTGRQGAALIAAVDYGSALEAALRFESRLMTELSPSVAISS